MPGMSSQRYITGTILEAAQTPTRPPTTGMTLSIAGQRHSENAAASLRYEVPTPRSRAGATSNSERTSGGGLLDIGTHLYEEEPVRGLKKSSTGTGKVSDTLSRTQGGMAINPKEGDPPPSGRIYGSTANYVDDHGEKAVTSIQHKRKKKGVYSNGPSAQVVTEAERRNPSHFRAGHFQPTSRRLKSPDFKGSAGVTTEFVTAKLCSHNPSRSPDNNDSSGVLSSLDDRVVDRNVKKERAHRERHEKHFRDMCRHTEEHAKAMTITATQFWVANDSSGVANLMPFPERHGSNRPRKGKD